MRRTCLEVSREAFRKNVSEIRKYNTIYGDVEKDIDSTSNNWVSPNYNSDGGLDNINTDKSTSAWRDYCNNNKDYLNGEYNSILAQDSSISGKKGDDDDFEKIYVTNVDLALKKVITKVADIDSNGDVQKTVQINRPKSEEKDWVDINPLINGKNDALYNMNKTPILVKRGQQVSYRIYVFNEGKTDAKALDLYDYLPKGLKVTSVEYSDGSDITKINGNTTGLDKTNYYYAYAPYLKVHLGSSNVGLIDSFNGTKLDYDYITVNCIVEDSAKGILTNVAEIATYERADGVYKADIDSFSNNWAGVAGNKTSADIKEKIEWINYAKGREDLIDGDWHTEFIGRIYNQRQCCIHTIPHN